MIILGAKSPLVVEIEEICARAGIALTAIISDADDVRAVNTALVTQYDDFAAGGVRGAFLPCAFAPSRRRILVEKGIASGCTLGEALVDPSAVIAQSATLGAGACVNARAVLGAMTMLGEGAFVNRSASLGHHCLIGAYASIGPGAVLAGNIRLGADAIIGAGAVVQPDLEIGPGVIVSAGAIVSRDVPGGALVVAERARVIENGASHVALRRGRKE
ncbi:MAG: hypothetical protein AAF626_02785 [Pseudomonadota bacterium]